MSHVVHGYWWVFTAKQHKKSSFWEKWHIQSFWAAKIWEKKGPAKSRWDWAVVYTTSTNNTAVLFKAILINNACLFFLCVSAGLSKRKSLTITPNCLVSMGEWCHGWAAITSVLYNIWIRVEKAGSHAFICHIRKMQHVPLNHTLHHTGHHQF